MSDDPRIRTSQGAGRWARVEVVPYKAEGVAPFKDISRQVLFDDAALACQWRYFEVAAGGHSTLERHEHVHAVLILRGRGEVLLGNTVSAIAEHDLVTVPTLTWHQFRAAADAPLGFLCMVNTQRDRPQLPTAQELKVMAEHARVASFFGHS